MFCWVENFEYVCVCGWLVGRLGSNWGRHLTVCAKDSVASPALSFRHVYIVYDCCLSDRFNLNWLHASKKERTDNGEHSSISTMRHVTVKNCWKLIWAVQQLVISVLSDSMINCHHAHLRHLSCLSKPRLITVREAQVGQHSQYGRETYHLSSSVCLCLTHTNTLICNNLAIWILFEDTLWGTNVWRKGSDTSCGESLCNNI